MGIASSAIGGAFDVAQTSMNIANQQLMQQQQFNHNEKMAEQQHEYNLAEMGESASLQQENWEKQFNMQNDYNSPSHQMQLLKEAGLNPVFQGLSDTSPSSMSSAASAPSGNAGLLGGITLPQNQLLNFADTVSKMRDTQRKDELHKYNIEEEKANILKLLEEANKLKSEGNLNVEKVTDIKERLVGYKQQVLNETQDTQIRLFQSQLDFERFKWQMQTDERNLAREDSIALSDINYKQTMANVSLFNAQTQRMQQKAFEQQINNEYQHYKWQYESEYNKLQEQIKNNGLIHIREMLEASRSKVSVFYGAFSAESTSMLRTMATDAVLRWYLDKNPISEDNTPDDQLNQSSQQLEAIDLLQQNAELAKSQNSSILFAIKNKIGWKGSVRDTFFSPEAMTRNK